MPDKERAEEVELIEDTPLDPNTQHPGLIIEPNPGRDNYVSSLRKEDKAVQEGMEKLNDLRLQAIRQFKHALAVYKAEGPAITRTDNMLACIAEGMILMAGGES